MSFFAPTIVVYFCCRDTQHICMHDGHALNRVFIDLLFIMLKRWSSPMAILSAHIHKRSSRFTAGANTPINLFNFYYVWRNLWNEVLPFIHIHIHIFCFQYNMWLVPMMWGIWYRFVWYIYNGSIHYGLQLKRKNGYKILLFILFLVCALLCSFCE